MNRTASSTLFAALALLVLLGVALAAGCASTSSGSAATKTPTPAGTAAAVTTAGSSGSASGSSQGSAGSASASAVGADRLKTLIPRSAGSWTLDGDPESVTMNDAEGRAFTWVAGDYTKAGDGKGTIMIQDIVGANTPLKQQWQSYQNIDTNDMSIKSVTVKGFPAWDVYDKNAKDYTMMIAVGDRYIVYATVKDSTKADLDTLVNALDLNGLAALK